MGNDSTDFGKYPPLKKPMQTDENRGPRPEDILSGKSKIIDGRLYEASLQAKTIVEDALVEAEKIRAAAQQVYEAEKQKGYSEGFQQGLADTTAKLTEARQAYALLLKQAERDIIKLAFTVVRKIIGRELKSNPQTVVDIVIQAVQTVRQQHRITIMVNPADLETLTKQKERLMNLLGRVKEFTIRGDSTVKPGGCLIETEIGIIDAQLDTQINRLESLLLKK